VTHPCTRLLAARGSNHILADVATPPHDDSRGAIMANSKDSTPADKILGTSEARYRTLVENPNLGVFLLDRQGHTLFVNAKIQEMTGYTPDEFVQNSRMGFAVVHPDDHAIGVRAFRNALLGRPSQHNEFRLLHREGHVRWAAAACFPVIDDDERVAAVQVVVQDVTDRHLAEQELTRGSQIRDAETAVRFRIARMEANHGLIDVVSEISGQLKKFGVDHDTCSVQILNEDATDFICCSQYHDRGKLAQQLDNLRSLSWVRTSDFIDLHPWVEQVWRTKASRYDPDTKPMRKLKGGMSLIDVAFSHGTLAINRRSPHAFDAEAIALLERFAVVLSDGFQRFLDLLRRAQLEEQLRESQKMEAIGQLVAGVSHNFNNMLTVILGNLAIAQQELGDCESLDAALEASKRASEIIDELMLFVRRDSAEMELIDVQSTAAQAFAFCQRTFDDRVDLRLSTHRTLPYILGHAGRLQQVIINLCINARDAIAVAGVSAPRIDVDLDVVDIPRLPDRVMAGNSSRYVRLQIRDNGAGIDDDTRTRIFEPFYTTKGAGEGTGLGLSTAYAIVHDHAGWIDCEGRPGQGAQFSVLLPVAEDPPSQPAPPIEQAPRDLRGRKVLVVDDDTTVRRVLKNILEHVGCIVFESGDGPTALKLVAQMPQQIDLVLLDVSLPGMSGQQILAELVNIGDDLRVVVLTGLNIDPSQMPGAAAFMTKPVLPSELIDTVGRALAP
jgi:PAS domain S-box-containing protein